MLIHTFTRKNLTVELREPFFVQKIKKKIG
jgi:hypothetical protein